MAAIRASRSEAVRIGLGALGRRPTAILRIRRTGPQMHPSHDPACQSLGIVLVTGVSGFIGSRLARLLRQRGIAVRGLMRHGPPPPGVEAIRAELADRAALQ